MTTPLSLWQDLKIFAVFENWIRDWKTWHLQCSSGWKDFPPASCKTRFSACRKERERFHPVIFHKPITFPEHFNLQTSTSGKIILPGWPCDVSEFISCCWLKQHTEVFSQRAQTERERECVCVFDFPNYSVWQNRGFPVPSLLWSPLRLAAPKWLNLLPKIAECHFLAIKCWLFGPIKWEHGDLCVLGEVVWGDTIPAPFGTASSLCFALRKAKLFILLLVCVPRGEPSFGDQNDKTTTDRASTYSATKWTMRQ